MLAGLLGFIPGVGAMYNGQFAKGLAHIAVFMVLTSLADHVNGIFGVLVAGWVFYMAFEAYQTALARREGRPLPDPFGFNHIGERFGFHAQQHPDLNNAWSNTVGKMPGAAPFVEESRVDASGASYYSRTDATGTSSYQVDPAGNVYTSSTTSTPPPPVPGFGAPYDTPGYGALPYGVPPVPPPVGYGMPPVPPMPPMPPVRRSGLPTGAIWLIGLGIFALLGSLHPFAFLEGEATGGLFLIAFAGFLFWRRRCAMAALYPEGSPAALLGNVSAYRGAGVVFVVGLLTLLQGLHIVYWHESWPFLLIFLGVLMVFERIAQNRVGAAVFNGYPGYPPPPVTEPIADKDASVSIIPKYTSAGDTSTDHHDQEGR